MHPAALTIQRLVKEAFKLFMPLEPVVVARANCGFLSIELAGVPRNQSKQAASNFLKRHVPFQEFDSYIRYNEGHAAAWYWPTNKSAKDPLAVPTQIPESLFTTTNNPSGWSAIQCANGYDLQQCLKGQIKSSLFCADDAALTAQLNSLGLQDVPVVSANPHQLPSTIKHALVRAWITTRGSLVVAMLLLTLMSYWGLQGAWYQLGHAKLLAENNSLEQQLAPVVQLRQQVATLKNVQQATTPTENRLLPLLANTLALFPPEQVVRQIKYQAGKLQLRTLLTSDIGPELIAALEKLDGVNSVEIDSQGGSGLAWIKLEIES